MLSPFQRHFSSLLTVFLLTTLPTAPLLANNKSAQQNAPAADAEKFWNPLARNWLTTEQIRLLKIAHSVGIEDDSKVHAHLLQAILMQESHAGHYGRIGDIDAPVGKRSYGVMQIKISTARDVLERYPGMGQFTTEEELLIKLVTDDRFNISVASKHLLGLRNNTNRDALAVMAYNAGLRRAKQHWYPEKFGYVIQVRQYISKVITPFNKHFANKNITVALGQ